ncbi:BTB/POZ domain-containing protein 17-like isoform X2 [Gigantopelta aegis]|uniref:BTB/POZ domain-containing protein 17-like isoform X2 n=1 Tax=Gigantopelta aegis TaxID=1735272 RepID=UPI001B88B099|nr:BTB/POZ domain-containing protein 17-like isoform X2 [Gigantopelta aegis]
MYLLFCQTEFKIKMETDPASPAPMQDQDHILRDESDFIDNVSQFFNQEEISDVKLKVGSTTFFAHKFVLAKSSEVFRTMLYNKEWTQAGMTEVQLNESTECELYFDRFLKFLYTAKVNISVDAAVGILCLADKYSVGSLKHLCTQYMVEHTQSPKVKNALNWYSWAKALNLEGLIESCSKTIAWNAQSLLHLTEWVSMDIDFVSDILSNSDLVVTSEWMIYECLKEWLLDENHVASFTDNAKRLLPMIRFPQMLVSQLYRIESDPFAQREEIKDQILDLVGQAYRFRSLCPSQVELDVSFLEPFYIPRNYTDLTVDTVRMQNTLRFGIQVDVRTYVGPVPSESKDGEWKITYRKTNECWTLQIYCHESAMVNGEARIQASLIIYDDEDKVVQVESSPIFYCSRGNHLSMNVNLPTNEESKLMGVLIKPMPK